MDVVWHSGRCFHRTFVGVLIQPGLDLLQPVTQQPRVHEFTFRMAETPVRAALVYLAGNQADARIELGGGVVVPIRESDASCARSQICPERSRKEGIHTGRQTWNGRYFRRSQRDCRGRRDV